MKWILVAAATFLLILGEDVCAGEPQQIELGPCEVTNILYRTSPDDTAASIQSWLSGFYSGLNSRDERLTPVLQESAIKDVEKSVRAFCLASPKENPIEQIWMAWRTLHQNTD